MIVYGCSHECPHMNDVQFELVCGFAQMYLVNIYSGDWVLKNLPEKCTWHLEYVTSITEQMKTEQYPVSFLWHSGELFRPGKILTWIFHIVSHFVPFSWSHNVESSVYSLYILVVFDKLGLSLKTQLSH